MEKTANKMSFPFNFANISKGRHSTVCGSKNLTLSPDNAIDIIFQKTVLATLLLFFFVCY